MVVKVTQIFFITNSSTYFSTGVAETGLSEIPKSINLFLLPQVVAAAVLVETQHRVVVDSVDVVDDDDTKKSLFFLLNKTVFMDFDFKVWIIT